MNLAICQNKKCKYYHEDHINNCASSELEVCQNKGPQTGPAHPGIIEYMRTDLCDVKAKLAEAEDLVSRLRAVEETLENLIYLYDDNLPIGGEVCHGCYTKTNALNFYKDTITVLERRLAECQSKK